MKPSTPARLGLRTVALLYLFALLVVPIVLILVRTFGPGLDAFLAKAKDTELSDRAQKIKRDLVKAESAAATA